MKIKLSKNQWENIGKKVGWTKVSQVSQVSQDNKGNHDFNNLPIGTEVISNLYKREGKIRILDREEELDILNRPYVKYKAFFSNTGREGTINATDISEII
jgi:hypothetical protein